MPSGRGGVKNGVFTRIWGQGISLFGGLRGKGRGVGEMGGEGQGEGYDFGGY